MSGSSSPNALLSTVRRLTAGEAPDPQELTAAFDVVLSGDATPAQIAALLIGLRVRGETAAELAAVVRSFRRAMVHLPAERPDELVDTCGTGGGSINTFNISTAAALVAAGSGIRVAKHGNRSFTTQCGSADILEALGVSIEAPVTTMATALADAGIVFMFAPLMHPAMRHVGPVRRELGVHTVMNLDRAAGQPRWRRTAGGRRLGRETSPADRRRARRARRGPRAGGARGGDGRDLSVRRERT